MKKKLNKNRRFEAVVDIDAELNNYKLVSDGEHPIFNGLSDYKAHLSRILKAEFQGKSDCEYQDYRDWVEQNIKMTESIHVNYTTIMVAFCTLLLTFFFGINWGIPKTGCSVVAIITGVWMFCDIGITNKNRIQKNEFLKLILTLLDCVKEEVDEDAKAIEAALETATKKPSLYFMLKSLIKRKTDKYVIE